MDTIPIEPLERRRRRRHSEAFKADVVRACRQPGISIAAVALANGLNANLVRRWVAAVESSAIAVAAAASSAKTETKPEFVPLQLPPPAAPEPPSEIRIELQRGTTAVKVAWPASAAAECATWLRELLR